MNKTAITFRTPLSVKREAARAAKKMDISLSLVLTTALKNFAANPQIVLTKNGFTPTFENETLLARKEKPAKMTEKEFLASLD